MCGIAYIRLRKPLQYYNEKYGSHYALQKLYLLMQKQHNRGQNGAGVANIKIDVPAGKRYISRIRSMETQAIEDIFSKIYEKIEESTQAHPKESEDMEWFKENVAFGGEIFLGHLRYGTHGANSIENCHPFLRQSNWRSKNLVLAGNFNMTNVDELFQELIDLGQHPKDKVDTVIVLEKIGHFLDEENERVYQLHKDKYTKKEMTEVLENEIELSRVLKRAFKGFDGGYSIVGITGYGASFIARDPNGIRPAYYYADDEIIVAASEKTAIKAAFNVEYSQIKEIQPAHALIIDKQGNFKEERFIETAEKKACSFERIYFSRGSDPDIYNERKNLGRLLTQQVLNAVDGDLVNTIFSYIPNTAETAFLGLMKGVEAHLIENRKKILLDAQGKSDEELNQILSFRPRVEKLVIKDAKLRTFITDDSHRDELVAHVYDTTYEVVRKGIDNVVLLDDSIVRGTTLEKSILTMIGKLHPKKVVIVSSAPQIRFPDCYGIDMSKIQDFVAFRAVKELLEESNKEELLEKVFHECLYHQENNTLSTKNFLKELYEPFTEDQITKKIAKIVTPKNFGAEVEVIYQTVENLHKACPNHEGDWYFTGEYPTKGGNIVVNKAFLNFMKGSLERAY